MIMVFPKGLCLKDIDKEIFALSHTYPDDKIELTSEDLQILLSLIDQASKSPRYRLKLLRQGDVL